MSSLIPDSLKYTPEHEWAKVDGEVVTVGITDFAQSSLGDIVFVELPEVGAKVEKGQTFGVVESIKSVSDLYVPLTGVVLEKNTDVESSPELLNKSAYDAWMIKIKITNPSEVQDLLDARQYAQHCTNS